MITIHQEEFLGKERSTLETETGFDFREKYEGGSDNEEDMTTTMKLLDRTKARSSVTFCQKTFVYPKLFSFPQNLEIRCEDKYSFADPTPVEMNHVGQHKDKDKVKVMLILFKIRLSDISTVSIDWRMLTNARPKTNKDAEYYTKLILITVSRK